MRRLGILVVVAGLSAGVAPRLVGQGLTEKLKAASDRLGAHDYSKAAAMYGSAAAKAQRENDFKGELKVAEALRDFPVKAFGNELLPGGRAAYHALEACRDVLVELDPKRRSALVAAGPLAVQMIREQTRLNAFRRMPQFPNAVVVLEAQAALSDSGKCLRLMARYARALVDAPDIRSGASDESGAESRPSAAQIAKLDEVLKECLAEDWFDLAAFVSVDIAAYRRSLGDTEGALAALKSVADAARPEHEFALNDWFNATSLRLHAGPGDPFLAVVDAASNRVRPKSRVIVPEKPRPPGEKGPTALGKVFSGMQPNAVIVTVRRVDDGFDIREGFDKIYFHKQRLSPDIQHSSDGGVTLGFRGWGVALDKIELVFDPDSSNRWLPPGAAPLFECFYLLAKGETLTITKAGTVSIK